MKQKNLITTYIAIAVIFTTIAVSNQAKIQHQKDALAILKRNYKAQTLGDIDVKLIEAIIQVESSGNPNAVSSAGAIGLMQVMPQTAKGICDIHEKQELFNTANNINCGVDVLKYYIKVAENRGQGLFHALKYYNAGAWNKNKSLGEKYALKVLSVYEELV